MSRFLIVGLGNPGKRFEGTRHNVGFMVADALSRALGATGWRSESQALTCRSSLDDHTLVIAKPQTFMNNSGVAVRALARFSQVLPSHILVISDDLDLPYGRLRVRAGGSAGGHNGLKSIIAEIGTQEFPRLRIGIGRPSRGETIDWVLSAFLPDEQAELPLICDAAVVNALTFVRSGILSAMNTYNGISDVRPGFEQKITGSQVVRSVGSQGS